MRLVLVLSLFPVLLLPSQEISEKKELALFKLGHAAWDIPMEVLAGVDEQIKGVFINIRRFDVIGMNQRLEADDVMGFTDKIKSLKEQNAEIPQEVQMGKEFFTEADLNRLIGSFIVVLPSITNFITGTQKNGDYEVSLQTTFSYVNVEQGKTFAHSTVDTSGTDKNLEVAIKEAMDAIPMQLTFAIRSVPEFQLKTGIVEVNGRQVILVMGQDMGLKKGDEFAIVTSRVLSSGNTLTSENGLVYIQEVSDEASVGKVIYAEGGANVGDQLKEIPRLGFESTPYVHFSPAMGDRDEGVVLAGFRTSPIRGFYDFRPFVTLEVPFIRNVFWGLPFNLSIGGEYALYLGKLQVTPAASAGIGGAYLWYMESLGADENEFILSHVGGTANLGLSYMLNRNIRLTLDAGFLYWFSLDPTSIFADESLLFRSYGGMFAGVGASIRF
jgi:hypothetical protein